jgi:hypothetical protein
MIQPSGSAIFLMKWGCWGHWGCRGSKAWKITTGDFRIIQVLKIQLYFDVLKENLLGVKSWNIRLNFSTFSVRGCWGQPMLLFWKLVDETQMGNPRDHAASDISWKFSIFLPLRAILKKPYHYETPCNFILVIGLESLVSFRTLGYLNVSSQSYLHRFVIRTVKQPLPLIRNFF